MARAVLLLPILTPLLCAGEPQEHWAYVAPQAPEVPVDPFEAAGGRWARNPVDRFVAARLAAEGLTPAPEADGATLLRRASLDVTGLPPTPGELARFLEDLEPGAWSRAVDRLLASPHYAEHQARYWLDLARYADSQGYEKDDRRTMWRYRDWVIDAFARDLPFDRFTIEQLAGDLLPEPTVDQLIATGFHRNTMVNREGGTDPEEFRVAAVKDRVHTTAAAWLGTTLECAQCHDHEYDPFSQREYYGLYAFFDSTEDTGNSDEPTIEAPTAEQSARAAELQRELEALEAELATWTPALAAELDVWERAWAAQAASWRALRPTSAAGDEGTRLAVLNDGSVLALGEPIAEDRYRIRAELAPGTVNAVRVEVLPDPSLPSGGPGQPSHGNFVLSELEVAVAGAAVTLASARADFFQTDKPWPAQATIDGDLTTGWAIGGAVGQAHTLLVTLAEPLELDEAAELEATLEQRFGYEHLIGRLRLSVSELAPPEFAPVPAPEIAPLLARERSTDEQTQLHDWFRARAPSLEETRERLAALASERVYPRALVMRELEEPRTTRFLVRGSFLNPGQEIEPDVPAVFPQLSARGERPDRLDLARWLVAPENPLTARVIANRAWGRLFGTSLVATSDDFGTRGERPTHPALLDWLALHLQEQGWSIKALYRTLLLSSTYRQASRVTPELLEIDPANRLLARGPRHRLDAETLRDVALAASGLLDPTIGGPSVFPPQPEGTWMMTYSDDRWMTSTGGDRFRRGLYTFARRTAPYPTYLVFDATSRELACARRARTNTPLQALTLMNDPAFVECAVGLARRILREGGTTAEERVRHGFRLCTAREPQPDEIDVLMGLLQAERESFAERPAAARTLAAPATLPLDDELNPVELAAWTVVANALLNLDETVTKG